MKIPSKKKRLGGGGRKADLPKMEEEDICRRPRIIAASFSRRKKLVAAAFDRGNTVHNIVVMYIVHTYSSYVSMYLVHMCV